MAQEEKFPKFARVLLLDLPTLSLALKDADRPSEETSAFRVQRDTATPSIRFLASPGEMLSVRNSNSVKF